jgi:hypothetical protein
MFVLNYYKSSLTFCHIFGCFFQTIWANSITALQENKYLLFSIDFLALTDYNKSRIKVYFSVWLKT